MQRRKNSLQQSYNHHGTAYSLSIRPTWFSIRGRCQQFWHRFSIDAIPKSVSLSWFQFQL